MLLLEFNLIDLYELSDEQIIQGKGLNPTINRFFTQNYIRDYKVVYKENSYYNKGVFEFVVSGMRGTHYATNKKIKDPERVNTLSSHIVKIRPKYELNNLDELENTEVDIYCNCNDFKYVFMDMAYKGYKSMASKISKYGIVPVSIGGDTTAYIRNPYNKGALCKHALLTVERIMYDQDPYLLDKMEKDILDRVERSVPVLRTKPGEDDLIQFDDQFYDRDGKLKHKSKITISRDKKIQQLRFLIKDAEDNGLRNYTGDFDTAFDSFKQNILQTLMDFDSYYINKANEENIVETKYLPDNYQDSYDDLSYEVDRIKSIVSYKNAIPDDLLNFAFDSMDDSDIDDITKDLFGDNFDEDIDKLLGENLHIFNYENFKNKRNVK